MPGNDPGAQVADGGPSDTAAPSAIRPKPPYPPKPYAPPKPAHRPASERPEAPRSAPPLPRLPRFPGAAALPRRAWRAAAQALPAVPRGRGRRVGVAVTGTVVLALVAFLVWGGDRAPSVPAAAVPTRPVAENALVQRDPQATPAAQSVYAMLARLESAARAGTPQGTVLGQHVELHNERNNPLYGDRQGTKPPGYYYAKVGELAGALPGFVETDLGPGYGDTGWGVGEPRDYSAGKWPTCRPLWQYTDDAVDLLKGVWDGVPRGADGKPEARPQCDGSSAPLPDNGGKPSGIAGMSFHEPYPGSPVKDYNRMMCANSPAAKDPKWFDRVIDFVGNTPEYQALLTDLSFLADHLGYLAAQNVPVLLRPYHEMNAPNCGGFWWAGQPPAKFQALWRIMYDYLVTTRGLHNLIFVWSPLAWDGKLGVVPWDYYPGDRYVDMVGVDDYSDSPQTPVGNGAWTEEWYRGLAGYNKPRMLAETFHVPVNRYQQDTLTRTPWVIWNVWGQALTERNLSQPTGKNSPQDVALSYRSPMAITGGPAGSRPPSDGTPGLPQAFDWGALRRP